MSHVKAVVEFDYEAEASDELTLKVGDVLSNIINVEEGWCKGTLNGVTGMFPDNFVKIIEDKTAGTKSKKKDILRKMKVTFSYEPANEDELRLNVGDIVDVIADEEEGWARGILHGVEAVFPTNFAEDMKVDQPLPAEPDFINQKPDTYMSGGKKMKGGIGFGNIFGDGPIKLRQASFGSETEQAQDNSNHKNEKSAAAANGGKSTDSRKQQTPKQEIKTIATSPTEARKKNKGAPSPAAAAISTVAAPAVMRCRARVMFDYQAENSDELTLVKGEIVSVINQHLPDAGWWEGEIIDQDGRKRRGVFPDNFVAALPSADDDSEVESTKTKDVKSIDTKLSKIKTLAPDHQSRDDRHSRLSHNPVADSRGAEHEKSAYNKSKHQTSPSPAAKSMHLTNSKRLAPVAPAPPLSTAKPSLETTTGDENSSRDDSYSESTATTATTTAISEPASIKKLTHYKRPAGPKNRKRPDPSGRRERNPKQPEVSAASRKSISNPKPKPPPPKLKPTLPSSKPQPTGAAGGGLEEIRDDIRALRDTIHTIQHENRQELERLNLELQEERKQRLILQGEVDKLRRRCK